MNPDLIKEMLAVINEVSQPIYLAARQKVLVGNWGAIVVSSPLFLLFLIGSVLGIKDGDCEGLTVCCIALCLACLTVIAVSSFNLLTIDYQTYNAIRVLLLGGGCD